MALVAAVVSAQINAREGKVQAHGHGGFGRRGREGLGAAVFAGNRAGLHSRGGRAPQAR